MNRIRTLAAGMVAGAALALSLLRPLPPANPPAPCEVSSSVPSEGNPEGYSYTGGTPGVWSLDGRTTAYAAAEDSTPYTTRSCAN